MRAHLDRAHRAAPVLLGVLTLLSVAVLLAVLPPPPAASLLAWDALPSLFPPNAHSLLGALPLALIAIAYLAYQSIRRPGPAELFKALLLATAFLFWAANQYWP